MFTKTTRSILSIVLLFVFLILILIHQGITMDNFWFWVILLNVTLLVECFEDF